MGRTALRGLDLAGCGSPARSRRKAIHQLGPRALERRGPDRRHRGRRHRLHRRRGAVLRAARRRSRRRARKAIVLARARPITASACCAKSKASPPPKRAIAEHPRQLRSRTGPSSASDTGWRPISITTTSSSSTATTSRSMRSSASRPADTHVVRRRAARLAAGARLHARPRSEPCAARSACNQPSRDRRRRAPAGRGDPHVSWTGRRSSPRSRSARPTACPRRSTAPRRS